MQVNFTESKANGYKMECVTWGNAPQAAVNRSWNLGEYPCTGGQFARMNSAQVLHIFLFSGLK